MRSRYGIIPVTSTHYIVAAVCYGYTHISTLIRSVSQQIPSHVHHVGTLMRGHRTFRTSEVSRRFLHTLFSRSRLTTSTVFDSDISLRPDSALYNCVYWRMSTYRACLVPDNKVAILVLHAASCWCGVIWIWRYQRHSTACDGTASASDAPARLLRPVHQRLSQ